MAFESLEEPVFFFLKPQKNLWLLNLFLKNQKQKKQHLFLFKNKYNIILLFFFFFNTFLKPKVPFCRGPVLPLFQEDCDNLRLRKAIVGEAQPGDAKGRSVGFGEFLAAF